MRCMQQGRDPRQSAPSVAVAPPRRRRPISRIAQRASAVFWFGRGESASDDRPAPGVVPTTECAEARDRRSSDRHARRVRTAINDTPGEGEAPPETRIRELPKLPRAGDNTPIVFALRFRSPRNCGTIRRVGHCESVLRPEWVSDDLFPFESRFFTTPSGQQMHFVDEGSGDPIVFVHGNPSWSFEFRHLVKALRSDARCVAPDHIGFGLSSRSSSSEDHHPQTHARNLAALLDHLELRDITLFMSDWGGPIGLDFTRQRPQRVRRIVISNTWCWPVGRDLHFRSFSFFMSSSLGQYLIKRRNVFVNRLMPMAVGDRSVLTPEVIEHYRNAQADPEMRRASAALAGHIVGARNWLDSIWKEHARFANKPILILWGCRGHGLSQTGTRPVDVRHVGLRVPRVHTVRPLPGGRGARQSRLDAPRVPASKPVRSAPPGRRFPISLIARRASAVF